MKKIVFIHLFVIVFSVLPAFGKSDTSDIENLKADKKKKSIAIFESEKLMEISLELDLKSYLKKDFKESLDAVLTFHLDKTDSLSRNVKVNNRGTFRSSYCKYPPLEIYFAKTVQAYSGSGKVHRLKLFTCCDSGDQYDEYVLREYLVYKLYNVLTDTSYRVRLLKVSLIDTQKKKKPIIQYGFFLEPKEVLAERINSKVLESTKLGQKHVIPEVMDRLAIFNYMISNYDWSVTGQHNVTILQTLTSNPSGLGIAIPHDFDGTGVVNALYAVPTSESGLKSIRDRIFLGTCRSKEVFQEELKKFLDKKKELYRVVADFPYLNRNSKKDVTDFLDEFFDQIERQKTLDNLISNFMKNCKKS